MSSAPDESKLRFYKLWQAVQLSEGLSPTEAVQIALRQTQDAEVKTPDFFRGDVSATAIDKLDPSSPTDLEKAVLAFRDPFLLNRSFLVENASAKKRKADAMEVDTEGGVDAATGRFPDIDVAQWKDWLHKVESVEVPTQDAEGDATMETQKPSYQERLLESIGDLSSNVEKTILSKARKTDGGSDSNGSTPATDDRFGYPTIPPTFLDSPNGLRFLILVLYHPSLADPDSYGSWYRIMRAFRILTLRQREVLASWLADEDNMDINEFRDMVQNLQQMITITFLNEFGSSDMPADAMSDPDSIPEQLWDFFVMRASQKCKNALSCLDIFWKANLKRRAAAKCWRKAALTKGIATLIGESGMAGPIKDLRDDEFFNDALNSCERVLRHEFTHAIYFEHIELEDDLQPGRRRPQKPKSLLEIEQKSMLNNYTFGLLAHNFCLDAGNKCRFLMFDTASKQREEVRHEIMNQMLQGHRRVNPYLVLKVKRSNVVQDTLQRFTSLPPAEFRKKLKVVFEGEPGVDEGGLRKEFFQLLVEQLYDPNYAMFTYNSSNKTYWFNPGSFESNLQYEMFGALLGVAIYNEVILDIRFTTIVYEKLLAEDPAGTIPCSIDTLVDIQPDMAKSLLEMLKFEGNVEEVFCRNFVASYENFGAVIEVPLKEGGEFIPVTNANRAEYVDLYVDWFFNQSIYDKFCSFKRGFLRCFEVDEDKSPRPSDETRTASSNFNMFLQLFCPEELELLICGSRELDFTTYKNNTEYQDGYEVTSPVCGWFWEVALESFDDEQRRSLLMFISGSDRAPPKGLGAPEARLTISRQGPDCEQLPTSHTCFNHLLLPEYSCKEKLEAKLKLAIQFNVGFGMA
jgi:hypothetical protein